MTAGAVEGRGGGEVPVRNRAPRGLAFDFDSHSHFDYKYFDFGRHFTLPSQLLQRFVRILSLIVDQNCLARLFTPIMDAAK